MEHNATYRYSNYDTVTGVSNRRFSEFDTHYDDEDENKDYNGSRKGLTERILLIENNELKEEIKSLRKEIDQIQKTRSSNKICQQKLNEAESQTSLYKKQIDELRKLLSAEQKAARLRDPENLIARVSAFDDRIKELQHENFELRRQLAGLTPERLETFTPSPKFRKCKKCLVIAKQKAQQAKYFESKLIENRKLSENYRQECQKLNEKSKLLENEIVEMRAKYKSSLEKQNDNVSIYRHRSERLEKRSVAQLKGLETEIDSIKTKLMNIEKALLKTQLTLVGKDIDKELTDELKKITSESKLLSQHVKKIRTGCC